MSPFAKKALSSFVMRFGALGLQFAGSVIIARALGAAAFGVYTTAFTCTVLLGVVVGLGLGPLAERELPKYMARGEHGAVLGYITMWAGSVLSISIVLAAILVGLETYGVVDLAVDWRLLALAAFIQALVLGLSNQLNSLQQILRSQMLESIFRQSLYLATLGLLLWFGITLSAARVFTVSVAVSLPVVALMAWLLIRTLSEQLPYPRAPMIFTPAIWFAASLPILATNLATQMQSSLDVLMLGFLTNDSVVGLYRVASRGAELALIASALAGQVLGPMLSKALANHNKDEAQRLISQSAGVSVALGALICGMLILFPMQYLAVFGAEFRAAAWVLTILAAAQMVSLLCGPVALILVMLHREKLVLLISVVGLALNCALNLVLIPIWGGEGAAIASFTCIVIVRLIFLGVVLRQGDFDPTLWLPAKRQLGRMWARWHC